MKNIVLHTFREVNRIIPAASRKKQVWIMVLLFVNSIFDIIGLSSLFPLITVVLEENIQDNYFMLLFQDMYGLETVNEFLVVLGLHIAGIVIIKNISSLLIYRQIGKYAFGMSRDFAVRAIKSKYKLDYLKLFSENSHTHVWEVNSLPNFFVNFVVLQLYNIINELIIVCIIFTVMVLSNPSLLLLIGLTIVPAAGLFYRLVKNKIQSYEEEKAELLPAVASNTQQMIFGYTDVKITGTQHSFFRQFTRIVERMKKINTDLYIIRQAPTKVIETAMVFGIVILILYGVIFIESRAEFTFLLTIYALSAFRLAPSGNKIMLSLMSIKKYQYTFDRLKKILKEEKEASDSLEVTEEQLDFEKEVTLENIVFNYNEEDESVLKGVQLNIPKGKSLGIVGKSGSGKSTLMKIILGFLKPQSGSIRIDGVELTDNNLGAWRKLIGYVSQDVFIVEGSIEENVAFGIPQKEIDHELLQQSLQMASLKDFVDALPDGIHTQIGERGSQISGGQKQRIAIARALYSGATILFFDEATSALDKITEREITESIRSIGVDQDITTIIIAHNVQTLKYCDEIVEMEEGSVVSSK